MHYLPIRHTKECGLPQHKNARVTGDLAYRGPMFVCKHVFKDGAVQIAGHTELNWEPEAKALAAFGKRSAGPPYYNLLAN